MKIFLIFSLFFLSACSKNSPETAYFDFVHAERISYSAGVLQYKIDDNWVLWMSNKKIPFVLSIRSLDGNCIGSISVEEKGQIPFSILYTNEIKTIFFGNGKQIICQVENNQSARFSIYPSLLKRGFFDPDEESPAATFELTLGANVN